MRDPNQIVDQLLARIPERMQAEVRASSGRSGLTRFANSFIHQNVAEESADVSLTLVDADRRVASAAGKVAASEAALDQFVHDALQAVEVAPVREQWPGLTEPVQVPDGPSPASATATAEPADRAARVRDFVSASADSMAAGYCQTEVTDVVYANTTGHRAAGTTSSAILDGIHRRDGAAGSGHAASRDLDDLDGSAAGRLAVDRLTRSLGARDLPPGEYEVVLAPEAVATIVIFLGFYGFNGKQVVEGQSFASIGEQQFDPAVTLIDDGTDPRAMRLRFDAEGTPKRPVDLIREGVTSGIAYDRRQAARAGVESTGHSVSFFGGYLGPIPTDLYLVPGEQTVEELVAGVERGIYVSTFNYVRILDPRTTVATGLTRNGTFLVENGEITGGITDMRFTQSFAGALAPGRVLGAGSDARFADSEFGPGLVHAPSLRLAGWRFTGGAAG